MKTNKSDANKMMIVSELLNYLAEHPQAQDTLEGISNWWVLEQELTQRVTEVQAALAKLIKDGFVLESQGEDGRMRYKLNQERQKEIQSLIKK